MRTFATSLYAFSISLAAALVAGCGGSQPPIAAPGAMTQTSTLATHANRSGSWMLPEAKGEDLLYVATPGQDSSGHFVAVFTYPGGSPVGQLSVYASQLCSDRHGNIFVTQGSRSSDDSKIVEYAHGGQEPIATLSDPYNGARGCSVDPATGNLAVANGGDNDVGSTVLVYPGATGTPKVYKPYFLAFYCGYDSHSDLFVMGYGKSRSHGYGEPKHRLAELAKDSRQFTEIKQKKTIKVAIGVQWDGTYVVLGDGTYDPSIDGLLFRYKIEGNRGVFVSTVRLHDTADSFFIKGSTVIVADGVNDVVLLTYPGAVFEKAIAVNSSYAVTVSVAPPASHTRK